MRLSSVLRRRLAAAHRAAEARCNAGAITRAAIEPASAAAWLAAEAARQSALERALDAAIRRQRSMRSFDVRCLRAGAAFRRDAGMFAAAAPPGSAAAADAARRGAAGFAARMAVLGRRPDQDLVAVHVYVRNLGRLFGGRLIAAALVRSHPARCDMAHVPRGPGVTVRSARHLRDAMDAMGRRRIRRLGPASVNRLVHEGVWAFRNGAEALRILAPGS